MVEDYKQETRWLWTQKGTRDSGTGGLLVQAGLLGMHSTCKDVFPACVDLHIHVLTINDCAAAHLLNDFRLDCFSPYVPEQPLPSAAAPSSVLP